MLWRAAEHITNRVIDKVYEFDKSNVFAIRYDIVNGIRLATLLYPGGKLVTIMVVFRLVVLCFLTFFTVEVLASNLTSRATGLENIPPCGVSRLYNGNYCAKILHRSSAWLLRYRAAAVR
jgi:hypothetical protein